MSFHAARLNLRLFLDGVEVPVIGSRCVFSEGAPATAEIQVVPTDAVFELEPRAKVGLFVYEPPSVGQSRSTYDLRNYKGLFFGELAGVALQRQGSQNSALLSCVDPTNYLDFIKQHYFNFRNGGIEFFENAFMGVNLERLKFFDVTTKGAHSNVYVWLSQSKYTDPETGESYANLYLGVQRLLRELFFASNQFHAQAFNRWRMGDMIVGLKEDKTAAKFFTLDFFEKFIKRRLGGAGGFVTARQVIELLLGTSFHNTVTIPCPFLDYDAQSAGYVPNPSGDDISRLVINREARKQASLNYVVVKPDTWFFAPPACNVLFPHQYNSLAFQRNYLQEPTRMFLRTSLIFTGQNKCLTERFYAPGPPAFEEGFNAQFYAEGGYLDRLSRVQLPHEEFVGLNPLEAWQPDLGAYVQKGPRRKYLAAVADYLFWKYRFSTRTMNVSAPLNLDLIPGYPLVLMNRTGVRNDVDKHFIGHVQTITHSIDQTGGWTHVTMTGARPYDEEFDPDGKSRPLQEVMETATGGYLDERYAADRIGLEVYGPLFGCQSVTDVGTRLDGESIGVVESVDAIAALYRQATRQGLDLQEFARSISYRPKVDMVEAYGIPTTLAHLTQPDQAGVRAVQEAIDTEDTYNEGFFSVAVDTEASDLDNDTYTNDDGETSSYNLKSHLEKRQEKVVAYLDSLELRGIRG